MRHWGLNPDERTRVQAQRNAAVDVMNSDGYLSVASGRWKVCSRCIDRAIGSSRALDWPIPLTTRIAAIAHLVMARGCDENP